MVFVCQSQKGLLCCVSGVSVHSLVTVCNSPQFQDIRLRRITGTSGVRQSKIQQVAIVLPWLYWSEILELSPGQVKSSGVT